MEHKLLLLALAAFAALMLLILVCVNVRKRVRQYDFSSADIGPIKRDLKAKIIPLFGTPENQPKGEK